MGTTIVSLVSQLTGDISKGVGTISLLFIIGIVLFRFAVNTNAADKNESKQDEVQECPETLNSI